jgi:hypothetical protein
MLLAIDEAQPEQMRIGDFLKAERIEDVSTLQIGDEIVWLDWHVRRARERSSASVLTGH